MASMTPAEYRAALDTLGLGVNEFARMCDMDERRARRWAADDDEGPSPIAAAFLRYMLARAIPKPEGDGEGWLSFAQALQSRMAEMKADAKAAGWDKDSIVGALQYASQREL